MRRFTNSEQTKPHLSLAAKVAGPSEARSASDDSLHAIREACTNVYQACLVSIAESIESEASPSHLPCPGSAEQMSLLLSCAQICHSTATLIELSSEHLNTLLKTCADICDTCSLNLIQNQNSLNCAEICSHCARTIREYLEKV